MKLFKNYAAVAAFALLVTLAYTGNALAGPGTVGLGTAASFAVLAHTGSQTRSRPAVQARSTAISGTTRTFRRRAIRR